MSGNHIHIIQPVNEPVLGYLPDSPERTALKTELVRQREQSVEIPLVIGGRKVHSHHTGECRVPHDHAHRLGTYQRAG